MRLTVLSFGLLALSAPAFAADDAASAMQAMGDQLAADNPEGGGSIRAKKEPDTTAMARKNDKRNITAKVVGMKKGAFPQVALVVKVTKPADDGPNKDKVKKDDQLILAPNYKLAGKTVDLADNDSVLNAGAFYLAEGDTVYVRLDALTGKVWKVAYIERK